MWRLWTTLCRKTGRAPEVPSPEAVQAFLVARTTALSRKVWGSAPVRPSTAGTELGALTAECRKQSLDLAAFRHEDVRALCRRLGTSLNTDEPCKQPFLAHHLRAALRSAQRSGSAQAWRDAALLAVGFHWGLRAAELVALRWSDVQEVGGRWRLAIRADKTNRAALGTQRPRLRWAAGDNLSASLEGWRSCAAAAALTAPEAVAFPRLDKRRLGEAMQPATVGQIVKKVDPELTGHSMRVGYASAQLAAGASELEVSVGGRWRSESSRRRYMVMDAAGAARRGRRMEGAGHTSEDDGDN